MNYRHAFHAGNFADVFKHALLIPLLEHLARKPAPFFVLDTHAGPGRADLSSVEAKRTQEAVLGVFRVLENPPAPLRPYVSLITRLGLYPGSPAIIGALLRPSDRLACCELHPEDYAALRRLFARDAQVAVHHRDAWESLRALLPPKERRGLVLIDPPFEQLDEFSRLTEGVVAAHRRFPQGIVAAWFPIKHRAPTRVFLESLLASPLRDIVIAELTLREPVDPARLNGCALAIVNPPYLFDQTAEPILAALLDRLGNNESGQSASLVRLKDE